MTDWSAYREAPKKVLGMTLKEAEAFLLANDFTYGIASVDGVAAMALPAIVMIHLYAAGGKVVKTTLDGETFELGA